MDVNVGDVVGPEQVIGSVGGAIDEPISQRGTSTGAHLDFGVYQDGKAIDPADAGFVLGPGGRPTLDSVYSAPMLDEREIGNIQDYGFGRAGRGLSPVPSPAAPAQGIAGIAPAPTQGIAASPGPSVMGTAYNDTFNLDTGPVSGNTVVNLPENAPYPTNNPAQGLMTELSPEAVFTAANGVTYRGPELGPAPGAPPSPDELASLRDTFDASAPAGLVDEGYAPNYANAMTLADAFRSGVPEGPRQTDLVGQTMTHPAAGYAEMYGPVTPGSTPQSVSLTPTLDAIEQEVTQTAFGDERRAANERAGQFGTRESMPTASLAAPSAPVAGDLMGQVAASPEMVAPGPVADMAAPMAPADPAASPSLTAGIQTAMAPAPMAETFGPTEIASTPATAPASAPAPVSTGPLGPVGSIMDMPGSAPAAPAAPAVPEPDFIDEAIQVTTQEITAPRATDLIDVPAPAPAPTGPIAAQEAPAPEPMAPAFDTAPSQQAPNMGVAGIAAPSVAAPAPAMQNNRSVDVLDPASTVAPGYVTGLAPSVREQAEQMGVTSPAGSRIGYSPTGTGFTSVYSHPDHYSSIAATGPGIFGAVDKNFDTDFGSRVEDFLAERAQTAAIGMAGGAIAGPLGALGASRVGRGIVGAMSGQQPTAASSVSTASSGGGLFGGGGVFGGGSGGGFFGGADLSRGDPFSDDLR
jgi:hypothetical protein